MTEPTVDQRAEAMLVAALRPQLRAFLSATGAHTPTQVQDTTNALAKSLAAPCVTVLRAERRRAVTQAEVDLLSELLDGVRRDWADVEAIAAPTRWDNGRKTELGIMHELLANRVRMASARLADLEQSLAAIAKVPT